MDAIYLTGFLAFIAGWIAAMVFRAICDLIGG